MNRSIKTKMTIMVFAILSFLFLIQIVSNYLFAESFYVNRKTNVIQEAYDEICNVSPSDDKEIIEIMSEYEESYNLQFILSNEQFTCIYNSRQNAIDAGRIKYKLPKEINFEKDISRFSKNAKPVVRKNSKNKGHVILYGIVERTGSDYYIVIQSYIKSIQKEMKEANQLMLYLSLFALPIGAVAAYLFARKISGPIEEIDKVARHVSKLDFSFRAREGLTKDEIGHLAGSINMMSDRLENNIKELIRMNERLEADNRYKEKTEEKRKEFIANISHELKTPLAILSGYAELLGENIEGIEKEYYYSVIQDEASKMTELVNQLMNLFQMEHGLETLRPETLNITELVSGLMDKNQILCAKKGIQYSFESEEDYYAPADKDYLERAVSNYISNAISYTAEGGKIKASVSLIQGQVKISVFNEGIRIAEEELDKIWDSFYQTDPSRKRTPENRVGLGLSIVSSIVSAHHGQAGVENKENGVEFYILLKQ